MTNALILHHFEKLVKNKFKLYNSFFLNLPYPNVSSIGVLIPELTDICKKGLEKQLEPEQIINNFFAKHTKIKTEKEKIDFMFRIIQYVERQVVLFDSVEDAAFKELRIYDNELTFKDYLHLLKNNEQKDKFLKKLREFSVRIVFTAHPTQFYPPSVLDIIAELRTLINKNDINELDLRLQQLGLTSLQNSKKPTPLDEAKNIIYFLRNIYYDAALELYRNIKMNIPEENFENPDLIQFGFWPGGDRDGNPFVTANVTKDVADELRMNLMKCYYKDLKNLQKKLTFRKIENILSSLIEKIYVNMFDKTQNIEYVEIKDPLLKIKKILIENYNSLYIEELEDLINKVKIFKKHFATIDIRQDHSVHKMVIEEILKKEKFIKNNLNELKDNELQEILLRESISVLPEEFDNELVQDTIQTVRTIKYIQDKNGEYGCNRYIISNSEDVFSVLFVYALLKWSAWGENEIRVDIVPLFESMEGMKNSEQIMTELFETPEYRQHIKQRKNIQTIMLGFSDGTKDGGYLQANWSIFKTKENLSEVCKKFEIKPVFFDGRGGPPARGGGKSHRFYAAQSNKIESPAIQLTIQGQTISSKYGAKEQFKFNLEQLITAGLKHNLFNNDNVISQKQRQLLEKLAQLSYQKYNDLKNHEKFIPYLEKKSTLKYYSKANIGSRPAKRGNKKQLELKDLRAISFVGSWSQLKQNVPGYFGVGTALKTLIDEGMEKDLKNLFKEVPFFKALILNSMMSLTKSNFNLTSYIAKDNEFNEFWNILYEEYKLTKEMILLISGYNILMEEEAVSRRSIEIREEIVLPLLVIQQYALQKIEKDTEYKHIFEKIVERSLYGNINASRNSA